MKTLANSIMKMRRNSFRQMLIFCPNLWKCLEIGSRDGRTFASHQYDPGSIPAWCHMLVELFAGSHLEFSPRSPIFLPLQDSSQHLIFTIQLDRGPAWKSPKADVVSALNTVNLILKSVKFSTELHAIIIKRKS